MQDRVPLYPGRVQLVPVAGQTNVYDMTMADQPQQVGTALNKANLLKDATAALFGLGASAVPDDVFSAILNIGNWYVWEKLQTIRNCGYTSTKRYTTVSADCAITSERGGTSIRYGNTFEEVAYGGGSIIVNPGNPAALSPIRGKYFVTSGGHSSGDVSTTDVYYADENATISQYSGTSYNVYPITRYVGTWATSETTSLGYVSSPKPNAYPPSVPDGYDYIPFGQLGLKTRIEHGSYIGNGDTSRIIILPFSPKLMILYAKITNNKARVFLTEDYISYTSSSSAMSFSANPINHAYAPYLVSNELHFHLATWGNNSDDEVYYTIFG